MTSDIRLIWKKFMSPAHRIKVHKLSGSKHIRYDEYTSMSFQGKTPDVLYMRRDQGSKYVGY